MAIVINSGQHITGLSLGINPTTVGGNGAGGVVDISTFTNLVNFTGIGVNMTGFMPITGATGLRNFNINNNRIVGPMLDISTLSQLRIFTASAAGFQGTVPNFSANNNLITSYHCGNNTGLSGQFPVITGLTGLQQLYINNCNFTGTMPSLTASNRELRVYWCSSNDITGFIPPLPSGAHLLRDFNCANNQLTGFIPNFFPTGAIRIASLQNNFLTDFTGRFPANISGLNFNFSANRLTPSAISGILQELVNSNSRTGGLSIQAGTNARVTGAVDLSNLATLSGRGWSVTFNP